MTVREPSIGTYAHSVYTADADHPNAAKEIPANGDEVIIDEITYNGLEPGQPYVVTGQLYNKSTGDMLAVNGKPLTVTKTFTPEQSSGTVKMEFKLSALGMQAPLWWPMKSCFRAASSLPSTRTPTMPIRASRSDRRMKPEHRPTIPQNQTLEQFLLCALLERR